MQPLPYEIILNIVDMLAPKDVLAFSTCIPLAFYRANTIAYFRARRNFSAVLREVRSVSIIRIVVPYVPTNRRIYISKKWEDGLVCIGLTPNKCDVRVMQAFKSPDHDIYGDIYIREDYDETRENIETLLTPHVCDDDHGYILIAFYFISLDLRVPVRFHVHAITGQTDAVTDTGDEVYHITMHGVEN